MRHRLAITVLAATFAATSPVRAQPSKDMLNQARTQAERQALEDLIGKLENRAGQRTQPTPAPPVTTKPPAEETKAEELARQLREGPVAPNPGQAAMPPVMPPRAPATSTSLSATPPAITALPREAVAIPAPPRQEPDTSVHAAPSAVAVQVAPPPGLAPPEPEHPTKTAATAILPKPTPLRQPPSTLPAPANEPTAVTEQRPPTPPPKRLTSANRKALCTEVLQRASVGELTDPDREFLKAHCH